MFLQKNVSLLLDVREIGLVGLDAQTVDLSPLFQPACVTFELFLVDAGIDIGQIVVTSDGHETAQFGRRRLLVRGMRDRLLEKMNGVCERQRWLLCRSIARRFRVTLSDPFREIRRVLLLLLLLFILVISLEQVFERDGWVRRRR